MVKLRLRRMGKKKQPFYRIVAADSRASRNGRFIETVGTYDPLVKPHKIELKEDRIYYWLGNGAQPTNTVKNLFQHKGLWLKWDLMKNGADDAKINEEYSKWLLIQDEKAKRLAAKAEEAKKAKQKEKDQAEEEAEAAAAPAEEPAAEEAAPASVEEPAAEEIAPEAAEAPAAAEPEPEPKSEEKPEPAAEAEAAPETAEEAAPEKAEETPDAEKDDSEEKK